MPETGQGQYHPRAAARRQPHVIDWDEAIANLLDILDDIYDPDV